MKHGSDITSVRTIKILKPLAGGKAYTIAAEEFQKLYMAVTGQQIDIVTQPDPKSDLVVIGSDAVNSFAHEMIFDNRIKGFNIKYGTDDYHLLSARHNHRDLLFIAGGRGRSTIYAVYDFFFRRANCRYFWDGDIIPEKTSIPIGDLNHSASPRFKYRGLRYFAHRSLHRFQAEHWNLEDWQREIDWLMKKKQNLFMLRIGQDDLFQKAFPEIVSYPAPDHPFFEASPRSYEDRTLFWSLEYRGELRKKLLHYAFDRDLIHPEDFGTMTHWYSMTPNEFLAKVKPDFMPQATETHGRPNSRVWDIRQEKNLDNYFTLTDTNIKEYGKAELFHTIGLAERKAFLDKRQNHAMKLYAYRILNRKLRELYPDHPLLIASWDMMTWSPEEVRQLIKELDPERTILFDYTSENRDEVNNFTQWDVVGKFPWIFGIFHAYERNSEVRGNYDTIIKRLQIAAADSFCQGMVFWPEISHSDTFMLEFFADNSWAPLKHTFEWQIAKFCRERYPGKRRVMNGIWLDFMPLVKLAAWGLLWAKPLTDVPEEPYFNILTACRVTNLTPEAIDAAKYFRKLYQPSIKSAPELLRRLSKIKVSTENIFLHRDILDIARTICARVMLYSLTNTNLQMEKWRHSEIDADKILHSANSGLELLIKMGTLLGLHRDYSLYHSLLKLNESQPVDSAFEATLKGNSENAYCRSFIYELFDTVYVKEMKIYIVWIEDKLRSGDKCEWKWPESFSIDGEKIKEEFYRTPLAILAPPEVDNVTNAIRTTLLELGSLCELIVNE